MDVLTKIGLCGVVPVVVLDRAEDAVPAAKALLAGGVDVIEITMRTPAALDAIAQVAAHCPDMLVGAGTVLNLEQCKAAAAAGAKFIVSPGFDKAVVEWCLANNLAVVPGCVTPTEITMALSVGLKVVKFFPANVYGGLSAMRSLAAPFGEVKFIPTGGVSADNLAEYISEPCIYAVGGTWFCKREDIANGRFEQITALSKEASEIAKK